MSFRVSPCIGLCTPDIELASQFYCDSMGMGLDSCEDGAELIAGPLHIFLDPGSRSTAVFELLSPDLEAAQGKLRFYGYETIVWNGAGKANIVRDPFGMVFNVFEFDEDDVIDLDGSAHRIYRPVIGAVSATPRKLAEFYSMVLQQPANRLTDGSYLLSGGDIGLRFRSGEVDTQVLWLSHDAPLEHLLECGCRPLDDDQSVLTDPFGLSWAIETRTESTHAVVQAL